MGYMKRGDEAQLKAVFDKYASANIDGVGMSYEELTIFFANFAFTGLLHKGLNSPKGSQTFSQGQF